MQVTDEISSESEKEVFEASDTSSTSENQGSSESEVDEPEKSRKKPKRKKTTPASDDLSAGAPMPKKKRGRRAKPKTTKDEFKKEVKKKLMMEILHPNVVENLNKKRDNFKQCLNEKKVSSDSRSINR